MMPDDSPSGNPEIVFSSEDRALYTCMFHEEGNRLIVLHRLECSARLTSV